MLWKMFFVLKISKYIIITIKTNNTNLPFNLECLQFKIRKYVRVLAGRIPYFDTNFNDFE